MRSLKITYRFLLHLPFIWALFSSASYAHTPHDVIDALAIPDTSGSKAPVFVARGHYFLLKSTDGGMSWKSLANGLDTRYGYTSIAVGARFDERGVVYVSTDGDGVYRSGDEGRSWKRSSRGLEDGRIRLLGVSPYVEPEEVVLAAGTEGGLYRTGSGGEDWERVVPKDVRVTAIGFMGDLADRKIVIGDAQGRLHESIDGGNTWALRERIADAGEITSIGVVGGVDGGGEFFIGTEHGLVYRVVAEGGKPERIGGKPGGDSIRSVAVSPGYGEDGTLYYTTWHEAVFRSTDRGATWTRFSKGLSTHRQADTKKFYSPQFRTLAFMGGNPEILFLAGFDGLFMTLDSGITWAQTETEPVGHLLSLALSGRNKEGHATLAVTTYGAGVYMARDPDYLWEVKNQGLKSLRLREVVFSPVASNDTALFTTEDEGDALLRSVDAGNPWDRVKLHAAWDVELKKKILGKLNHLGFPGSVTTDLISKEEKIKANPKGLVVSPDYVSDHTLFVSTRYRGNFVSHDGGRSVQRIDATGKPFKAWDLAISPGFRRDRTLYASGREQGIFKSSDGGLSWIPINKGLDFLSAWKGGGANAEWRKSQLGRSGYYTMDIFVTPGEESGQTLFLAGGAGLYKSVNAGNLWFRAGGESLGNTPYIITVGISPDYSNDRTMIVSVKGRGLYISRNGGKEFHSFGAQLLNNNYSISYVEFSSEYPADNKIYAASTEAVFVTEDDGVTWEYITRPVRYEDTLKGLVEYKGRWQRKSSRYNSATYASYSVASSDSVRFRFVGQGIRWIGERSPDLGKSRVYVDGLEVARIDQSGKETRKNLTLFETAGLPCGLHEIELRPEDSPGNTERIHRINLDAFEVIGKEGLLPVTCYPVFPE